MVARINTGKSIAKALNYNEQKVKTRQAEILSASGFLKEADQLNFYDKIRHFEKYTSLNEQAITNSLHVSLSFDPSEKLSNEKMVAIADTYMEQIGFGNQLFLVYRHHDAGHPHLHIVSTNIGKDGKRISMHNLGRNQSESARKQIEATFNLVKAESKKMAADGRLVPVSVQRVSYGKSATKQAISNVLAVVIEGYKYNSLHELNAVLKLYNVTADRGTEGSRQYEHHGLVYRVLDDAGNRVGKPVKASAFYMKPTLANLEKRFSENEVEKAPHRKRLQTTIGWILNKKPASLEAFIKGLEKENISTVLRRGKEGVIYGITYVDHKAKVVFNGSDLGKMYSANAIVEQCKQTGQAPLTGYQLQLVKENDITFIPSQNKPAERQLKKEEGKSKQADIVSVGPIEFVPNQLLKKKKRKKKRLGI